MRWDDLPGAGLATSTDLVNWSVVHQGGGADLQQTYFLPIDQAPDQLYFQLRRQ